MVLDPSSLVPNGTTAAAIDLDNWKVKNWRAFVIYYIKNILSIFSVIARVMVILAIIVIAAFTVARSIYFISRLQNKSQPVNTTESLGEQIPLPDLSAGDEKPLSSSWWRKPIIWMRRRMLPQVQCHIAI